MSSPAELEVLVIGIGNLLRRDDAVGRIIAQRLRERAIPGLRVLEQDGETTELLEAWAGADTVFVIDAISSGARPGTIRRIDAVRLNLRRRIFRGSTHSFGLSEAVELARTLHRLPRRLIVYGIEGKFFGPGAEVSVEVTKAAAQLASLIIAELAPNRAISRNHRAPKEHAGTQKAGVP